MKRTIKSASILVVLLASGCGDSTDDPTTNEAPVADAGEDRVVEVGDTVELEGHGTDGDGDDLSFVWEFTSRPAGSNTELSDATLAAPTFTADAEGTFGLRLVVADGGGGLDEDEVTVDAVPVTTARELSEHITEETYLHNLIDDPELVDYIVTRSLDVTAPLTIEPGTRIRVRTGSRLDIEAGGAIVSIGTEGEPILFEGESATPGSWQGIVVGSNDPRNTLEHTRVSFAGSSPWSNVHVKFQSELAMRHCVIEGSQTVGLTVDEQGRLTDFSNNTFVDNEEEAIVVPASERGRLDVETSLVGGNGFDGVVVSHGSVETDATWTALDGPTRLEGEIDVSATLTIDRGVQLWFKSNAQLDVERGGALVASGSASAPIVFRGVANAPGYWRGIRFLSHSVGNEFRFVHVTNGGSGRDGNVVVDSDAALTLTDSEIGVSSAAGLSVAEGGDIVEFARNTFRDNGGAAVSIPAAVIDMMDSESRFDMSNGYDGVDVIGGDVDEVQIWRRLAGSLRLLEKMKVTGTVSIEAGSDIRFWRDVQLVVEPGGALDVDGRADQPITFLGNLHATGYWQGIRIRSDTVSNRIAHADIGYGGGGGWANVYVEAGGRLTLTDSNIHHSAGYGVEVAPGGVFKESGNTYADNSRGERN